MKRFITVLMIVVTILTMMGVTAHGAEMSAEVKAFSEIKVFQTEGTLTGTWTIGFQKDESGHYPCALDLGDGRIILVPLTDDEVNTLMCKALKEHEVEVKEAEKAANPSVPARVLDWITFWN